MLTVGELKEWLFNIPDDYLIASMRPGDDLHMFLPKRILLAEEKVKGQVNKYAIINNQGTHWKGKKNFELTGSIERKTGAELKESLEWSGL